MPTHSNGQTPIRPKRSLKLLLMLLLMIHLPTGCSNTDQPGITRVAPRGKGALVQTIAWSPTDENKILVAAYQTPIEPTEIYIFDLQTRQEQVVLKHPHANIQDAKWMPDGKGILILSGGDTIGFEKAGWWRVDSENMTPQYFMRPNDIAWSPDGTTIAQLREVKTGQETANIELKSIDNQTKVERTLATYKGMDSTMGLSWSPDGKYLAFAIGQKSAGDVYVLEMQSQQFARLTTNGRSEYPVWSPIGDVIAFVVGIYSIHLINQDGRCEFALPTPGSAWSPTWSPDGKKLAYVSTDGIYVLDLEEALGRDIYQGLCP